MTGNNPYGQMRQGTHALSLKVAQEIVITVKQLQQLLDQEVAKMTPSEREIFNHACERDS
jgi:hypothetical protein